MVLAALLLLQAKAVPFDGPAMMASELLARLSVQTGRTLKLGAEMPDFGIYLRSKDLTLQEIAAGISAFCWGKWEVQGDRWVLRPDTVQHGEWVRASGHRPGDHVLRWLKHADSKLISQVARLVPAGDWQNLRPNQRVVYSTKPTRGQRMLRELPGGVAKVDVLHLGILTRDGSRAPDMEVRGYSANGDLVVREGASVPTIVPAASQETSDLPVRWSDETLRVSRLTSPYVIPEKQRTRAEALGLIEPKLVDPLEVVATPILAGIGSENCLMAAPDSLVTLPASNSRGVRQKIVLDYTTGGIAGPRTVGRCTVWQYWNRTLLEKANRSRAGLQQELQRLARTPDFSAVELFFAKRRESDYFSRLLRLIVGRQRSPMIHEELARFYWLLPSALRDRLVQGKSLSLHDLPAENREHLFQMLYGGGTGPTPYFQERGEWLSGHALIGEPTQMFPIRPTEVTISGKAIDGILTQLASGSWFRLADWSSHWASHLYQGKVTVDGIRSAKITVARERSLLFLIDLGGGYAMRDIVTADARPIPGGPRALAEQPEDVRRIFEAQLARLEVIRPARQGSNRKSKP